MSLSVLEKAKLSHSTPVNRVTPCTGDVEEIFHNMNAAILPQLYDSWERRTIQKKLHHNVCCLTIQIVRKNSLQVFTF